MGKKAEAGTPKWLANKMRSKGLQKLRWYCQMCQKQCRDQNGFKCHIQSESHQRQLLIFADNPGKFLHDFSKEFEVGFVHLLKTMHGTKRVEANKVYQEYISDKEHLHMNATRWTTLTGFVMYLGKTGKCKVDETEKGWYITWIDRDPDTIARQERLAKKGRLDKDDEEKLAEFIEKQVAKAKAEKGEQDEEEEEESSKEFVRENEDDKVQLDMKMVQKPKKDLSLASGPSPSSVFKVPKQKDKKPKIKEEEGGRKRKSALDEIREEEEARKAAKMEKEKKSSNSSSGSSSKDGVKDYWLKRGIVVKIVTKSLGEKYYKQKAAVTEVVDRYGAVVSVLSMGAKVKLDQDHLETVIPGVGRPVLVVNGRYRGEDGTLESIDVDNFCAEIRLAEDGKRVRLPYEHFSKLHVEDKK